MGFVYSPVGISNIKDESKTCSLNCLVDTGATTTVFPYDKLESIGIERKYSDIFELADGSRVSYDIGYALITVGNVTVSSNVIFGEKDIEPILGVTVLESAGFVVDPVNKTLRKVDALLLKSVTTDRSS